ncbi:Rho GTPase activation protein (RhoGAP) with PH domain [Zea mays]|uniref:Rho GTPase activation protein (RhoGAP) with PH domain n=1 Tax=Zea mays TaxID=4577 RepID=A0A1D6LJA0_MAIZE|nr:Rho GTPase activation protein (RhoGAP) with PH domain [Zea mays]
MSASEFRIPYQQVSPSQPAENVNQFKTCRCGEGDPNSTSETGDSPPASCPNCQVLKSGHLLLSSKGIGWTSWKKRWFVLTRASLVFFRSDPNVPPPRGAEPIVTLGGIDLNNSGSVVIKEERKLLTVFFPDGHGERTFTLKAETTGDLNEWRNALESAIAQAPSIANTMGQNPIFSTDVEAESAESPAEHSEDRSVIGRPAKFALVDADGSPSFLEKALKFIEDHGKNEFSPEEDAHVIGDCIKYVLREMPSSPVPASCCTALVKAYRSDKARRLDEINRVINEVFPEPNRQLLQRTLKMMQVVESHKAVNRMSQSALAACMAPLLLRPLLLGECDIDNEFSMGGDSSFQLLQAAAAANHAQAIVIIMMEEFDQIFDDSEEGSCSSDAYTESEDDVDKEYSTDNDTHDDDGSYDSGEDDIEEDLDYSDDSEHDSKINANIKDGKVKNNISETAEVAQAEDTSPMDINSQSNQKQESCGPNGSKDRILRSTSRSSSSREKTMEKSCSSAHKGKRTLWGRTSARKDLSTEEIECCSDDEALVEKLESNKIDLQSKIAKEAKENAILWSSLEKRKEELHERRLALEKEVENLRDQLKRVMNLRRGQVSSPSTIDSKVRGQQLCCESCNQRLLNTDRLSGPESSSVEASPTVGSDPAFDMVRRQNPFRSAFIISGRKVCYQVKKKRTFQGDIEQSRKQAAQHSPSSRDKPSHEAVGGITQRAPQRGHSIAREGQDGSSSLSSSNSKWNLAQKQYSNSPLIRGLHVSSRLEDFGGSISPAASSALAKLTNRLNFLKERRALLASEMQSLDLGRPPTVKSPTPKGHESKNS